jgi:hypothetical protein
MRIIWRLVDKRNEGEKGRPSQVERKLDAGKTS